MSQWELEANRPNRRQALVNAYDQVAIGFGFESDWSRRWREVFFILEQYQSNPVIIQSQFELVIYALGMN